MSMGQEFIDDMLIRGAVEEENARDLLLSKCWKTADGRVLKVTDMDNAHIKNTVKWLERNEEFYFSDLFINLLTKELSNRGDCSG